MDRVKKVREFRLNCPSPDTNHYADKLKYPVRLRYYSEEIDNPDLVSGREQASVSIRRFVIEVGTPE